MGRELIIRSDEAYALADDLARRLELSATEVVEEALRKYRASIETHPTDDKAPVAAFGSPAEKAAFRAKILALGARARAGLEGRPIPDADTMLYDERGLPR